MNQEPKNPFYKFCEGIPIIPAFPEDIVKSALNYKPKKGDIFIVTYPKCGTTWMQHIVLLILRHGKVSDDPIDYFLDCPFFEMTGADGVDCMNRPGAIKTHFPYHKVPQSKDAKYIYVCRNPKDCLVSFYYHMIGMPSADYQAITFEEFFGYFIRGELPYGDYFDHVMTWYEHRNDPNVYIITYENLKKDIRGEALKIAEFIGEEYKKILLNDSKMLDDVIRYSSFEYTKKGINDIMSKFLKGEISPPSDGRKLPTSLLKAMKSVTNVESTNYPGFEFVRKGIVGDWKNHLSPDQLMLLNEREEEKTTNSEVMNLWK